MDPRADRPAGALIFTSLSLLATLIHLDRFHLHSFIGARAPMGYLEGRASIGPLQPVERVGCRPPTPSPATCTERGLVMFDSQSGADVARRAWSTTVPDP